MFLHIFQDTLASLTSGIVLASLLVGAAALAGYADLFRDLMRLAPSIQAAPEAASAEKIHHDAALSSAERGEVATAQPGALVDAQPLDSAAAGTQPSVSAMPTSDATPAAVQPTSAPAKVQPTAPAVQPTTVKHASASIAAPATASATSTVTAAAAAGAPSCSICTPGECLQTLTRLGPAFTPTGAVLINSPLFSFAAAARYSTLLVFNALTAFLLAAIILSAIVFFLTSRLTRTDMIVLACGYAVSALADGLVFCAYARWLVRESSSEVVVLRPRALVLVDTVMVLSLASISAIRSGINRFALGVAVLLFQMMRLSRPVLPDALAGWDGAFLSYGSMLRAARVERMIVKRAPP